MTLTKSCTKCGEAKTLDQFYTAKKSPDGLQARCKVCHNAACVNHYHARKADQQWAANRREIGQRYRDGRRAADPEFKEKTVAAARRSNFRRKYGLTVQDVERMVEEQDGKCASCGDLMAPGRGTHIDHCHDTGQVRALLCGRCNIALGHLRDDPERIMRLHAYAVRVCVPLKPESPLD